MGIHTLASSDWRIKIDTDHGMRWLSGDVYRDGQWLPVMPDCTDPATDLEYSNFLLLPYSNRIRNAQFEFSASRVRLQNAERHAIHGTLRDQTWQVQELSDTKLLASCDSRTLDNFNWPWPLLVECELKLLGPNLQCSLSVQNLADTDSPIGGGWHPYFVRCIGSANPRLSVPVSGVYPDTDGDCLPTGAAESIPAHLQFRDDVELPAEQPIDHCFSGLAGALKIHWPDRDITLTMQGSEQYDHAVLYNPDKPYFALEPVTNANDAINLATRGIDAGMETLPPGQTWRATLEMRLS